MACNRRWTSSMILVAFVCGLFLAPLGEAKPSQLRRRQLQEVGAVMEQQPQPQDDAHNVSLILAIHYVDNETAFELETPTGSLASSFCHAVQEQAAGPQVNDAASEVNLSIRTMSDGTTLECTIVGTVRVYDTGGEIIGPSFFSLQLELQQTVYVSSSQTAVVDGNNNSTATPSYTTDFIASLVENGFNRGRGGRVRFRSLLQGSADDFSSILDLDVLSSLSPPQQAPTEPPSLNPTTSLAPSATPTMLPTGLTTDSPSPGPTYRPFTPFPTTRAPTPSPTQNPTPYPTTLVITDNDDVLVNDVLTSSPTTPPTAVTTSAPTLQPFDTRHDETTIAPSTPKPTWPIDPSSDDAPSTTPTTAEEGLLAAAANNANNTSRGGPKISPLIIAACIGAAVAIVTCFCFFCILFWKQRQKRRNEGGEISNDGARDGLMVGQQRPSSSGGGNEVGEALARRKRHFGSRGSSGNNTNESSGLTSATAVPHLVQLDEDGRSLADTTLGEYTAGRKPPKKKRAIAASSAIAQMDDSFDEESLYTSPSKPSTTPLQPGRLIDEGDEQPPSPPGDLDIKVDYDDALVFASDHSGSGGSDVWTGADQSATASPLAAKVERMIDDELGEDSDDDDGVVINMGEESPISSMFNHHQHQSRRQQGSNVVDVFSPESNESDVFAFVADEKAAKAAADAAMANDSDDDDDGSSSDGPISRSDSRSSITEKIGNLVSKKKNHRVVEVVSGKNPVEEDDADDIQILSPSLPRKSPDAPGMYIRSGSDRFLFSPTPAVVGPPKSRSFSPSMLLQEEKKEDSFPSSPNMNKGTKTPPPAPSRVRSSRSVSTYAGGGGAPRKSAKEDATKNKPPKPTPPRGFFSTPNRITGQDKKKQDDDDDRMFQAKDEEKGSAVIVMPEIAAAGIESGDVMEVSKFASGMEASTRSEKEMQQRANCVKSDETDNGNSLETPAGRKPASSLVLEEEKKEELVLEEEKKEEDSLFPEFSKPRPKPVYTATKQGRPATSSSSTKSLDEPNMYRSRPLGSAASTKPRTSHFLPIPGDSRTTTSGASSRNSSPLNLLAGASSVSVASTNLVSPTISLQSEDDTVSSHEDDAKKETNSTVDSFLFDAVAQTLGPRSMSADMESLGGRSTKSRSSVRSTRSTRSHRSYGSSRNQRRGATAMHSTMSVGSSRISFPKEDSSSTTSLPTPRTLEHDLQRLESQLREIAAKNRTTDETASVIGSPPNTTEQQQEEPSKHSVSPISTTSSVVGSSKKKDGDEKTSKATSTTTRMNYRLSSAATTNTGTSSSHHTRISNKQRVIVVAPPGKLGVILANRRRANGGTVVSEVRPNSALAGSVVPGDRLVAIDGMDVSQMIVRDITAIMQERSNQERHLTVITTTELRSRSAQTVPMSG